MSVLESFFAHRPTTSLSPTALSALSGLLVYFHELKLDHLALARKFNHYTPAGSNELDHLVLDGKTLTNLEIFGTLR